MSEERKIYFTAGPAKIPREVMEQVQKELLNYNGLDISVLEMSHRSKEFDLIITAAEANLRSLLNIPDNYAVLFMHGGAKTQFSSAPMNLLGSESNKVVDYIINGSWSKQAAQEAEKYATVNRQHLKSDKFNRIPTKDELVSDKQAIYRYFCDNETIEGTEFNYVPESEPKIPLVSDMTSNFLSRPIDISKFGVIFAGAQKNCGVAGLVIVIVRKDLIGRHTKEISTIQTYQVMQESRSLLNTPLTFNIYVANLCFKWMLERGGLEAMDKFSKEKSGLVYSAIDNSGGFYISPVPENSRSRMNVVFVLSNKSLDSKFLEESKQVGLYELKGHRSVGGFRASLYHGVSLDDTKRLVKFMTEFRERYNELK